MPPPHISLADGQLLVVDFRGQTISDPATRAPALDELLLALLDALAETTDDIHAALQALTHRKRDQAIATLTTRHETLTHLELHVHQH